MHACHVSRAFRVRQRLGDTLLLWVHGSGRGLGLAQAGKVLAHHPSKVRQKLSHLRCHVMHVSN